MKRFIAVPMVIITGAMLLITAGCKKNVEIFTVTGIWEVDQTITYDDGSTKSAIIRYKFTGNEFDGSVATVPILSAGLFSGEYHVEWNHADFFYSVGRGPAWSSTYYTGEIYPGVEMIVGTLTGKSTVGTDVTITWTGNFAARKIDPGTM